MANSLPWSVKGVDPRTRDAAKAAARRAGMTLGEWLDTKIRVEAEGGVAEPQQPEQLDIAALSERLARLSQVQTQTARPKPSPPPAPDRKEVEVLVRQAETMEKLTRESSQRTAGALDSITRWIEKTEDRLAVGERTAAERQERATSVIAEAIKTMGERIAEIERRGAEAQLAAREQPAPRLAFSRDGLAAAVTDIRTRQRLLDSDEIPARSAAAPAAQERIAALREDLRALGSRLGTAPPRRPAANPEQPAYAPREDTAVRAIEAKISTLGEQLEKLARRDHFEPVLKPLSRIEAEVARLSQDRAGEAYQRFELEIAHLAAKIDALAARGGEAGNLAPLLRDIADLREVVAANGHDGRLEDLSHQIASLSFEVARLREVQPDLREMRGLSSAIEDVRSAVLGSQSRDLYSGPLAELGSQIDDLAHKLDALGKNRPGDHIDGRIDALQMRLERLAEEGPAAVTRQLDALGARIDALAASNQFSRMASENGAPADLGPIEAMLQRLADKIDEAGAPGAGHDSFEALEQQISGIAARLDEVAATRNAESGIERTLQDLVTHLRSMREETSAERAALAKATSATPAKGIAELSTLVTGLRDTQVSTERQTQDTLGAVHHTLEAIMGRLVSLEGELLSERKPARPAAPRAAEPQAKRPPAPEMREPALVATAEDRSPIAVPASVRAEPTLDIANSAFDLPLEPGSGRPRPEAGPAGNTDAQSIRQSLIAAARRSAKAASEAAATPSGAADEPAAKAPGRLREIMAKRKRPLLLALAAVILAMGTAHVVTGALRGGPASTAHNDVPALPSAALPDAGSQAPLPADPAPAKDKSSALPAEGTAAGAAAEAEAANQTAGLAPAAGMPPVTVQQAPSEQQSAADALQPVTGLGDLPAGLGGAGVRKAALDGDARAVYELATRAADGPAGSRDPKLALRLFERAAVAGLAPAQFRLGNMFEKGVGTQRDLSLARVWYERAAERGNAKAMHNLAVLYAEGAAGKPDYASATQWFAKAAELGVRDSQFNLAVLLGRGLGAPMDLAQSYVWFSVAAAQGDEDAGKKRDEVAQRLKPEELAVARSRAAGWHPKTLNAAANEVAPPAKGWDAAPTAAADKAARPGKPARS